MTDATMRDELFEEMLIAEQRGNTAKADALRIFGCFGVSFFVGAALWMLVR